MEVVKDVSLFFRSSMVAKVEEFSSSIHILS
jgi:hypothetical protein